MVYFKPSTATRTITVLVAEVLTTLSISAPASVAQGAPFNISGILIRNDTGYPIPNAQISIHYNGYPIGSGTTGVDGDYLITGSIPSTGTFTLTASFAGMTVAGLTFGESSAFTTIGLGEPGKIPWLLIGLIGLVAFAAKKK